VLSFPVQTLYPEYGMSRRLGFLRFCLDVLKMRENISPDRNSSSPLHCILVKKAFAKQVQNIITQHTEQTFNCKYFSQFFYV
jgi:hypothetical protein